MKEIPHSVLVQRLRDRDFDVGMAHSREELEDAVTNGSVPGPNPVTVLRKRIHDTIAENWQKFDGVMDRKCQECYLAGQKSCPDLQAIQHWMAIRKLYRSER